MKREWIFLAVVFLASRCVFAAEATTAPADVQIKEAVKRHMLAVVSADRKALRDSICGKTPQEERAADILSESLAAQRRLEDVIRLKFGAAGARAFFNRNINARPDAEDISPRLNESLEKAKIDLAGDEARLVLTLEVSTQTMWVTRCGGKWRVWIGSPAHSWSPDGFDFFIRNNWYIARVSDRVAEQVESGKFPNATLARHRQTRWEQDEKQNAGPTSQPIELTPEERKRMIAEEERLEAEAVKRVTQSKSP